jgi:hypothetical protein
MIDLDSLAYIVPNLNPYSVDTEKFWFWWDQVNIPIKRLAVDSRGNGSGYNGEFWDGVTIWQLPEYQKNLAWKINFQPNDELFSNLIEKIHCELPWFKIQGITLWSNKSRIPPHQDGFPRDRFPSAPRISLIDDCSERTFFLISKKKYKQIVPDLTQGPNLFFFNNESYLHGATEPKDGRKVLVRIDGPLIDPVGLKEFINNQIAAGARYEGI